MSYLDRVLQPGETIRYRSRVHWLVYWPAAVFLLLAVVGLAGWIDYPQYELVALAVMLIGAGGFAVAWLIAFFRRWTTEIAVTDRRVIYKVGLVARRTVEMNMDKIESVDVDQSVLGRIFGYGTVVIRGTGAGMSPLRGIDGPIELRNHVLVR